MAYDAETDAIYGCSRTAMFQIDPDTGTAATLGPIAGPATPSLALGYQLRQQTLYGTDQYYLYEVDPDSAVWTRRGIGLGVGQITGLAYDSGSDILYGCSTATDSTYRIDTESGRAILVGQSTHSDANSLAYVP